VLHLLIHGVGDAREVQEAGGEVQVLGAGHLRVEAEPELDHRRHRAVDRHQAPRR
jgi:hypothetical protein